MPSFDSHVRPWNASGIEMMQAALTPPFEAAAALQTFPLHDGAFQVDQLQRELRGRRIRY